MNRAHTDYADFLRDAGENTEAGLALLTRLTTLLRPESGGAALQARIMASLSQTARFTHHAEHLAKLLDLTSDRAAELLAGVDRPESWQPGPFPTLSVYHLPAGPRVTGAITGFFRLAAGSAFPPHTHLGEETVWILQGSFQDSGGAIVRAGEVVQMPAGSSHAFQVLDGPDLIYLAVVYEGVEVFGTVFRADDPNL